MLKEVDEALKVFEETGSELVLMYVVNSAASTGGHESLANLQQIEGTIIRKMYKKREGTIPPAIVGVMAFIEASKDSYRFPEKSVP